MRVNKEKEAALRHARLTKILAYDPETGQFTWKISVRIGWAGKPAGTLTADGYIRIKIDGYLYLAHRLAWFYLYQKWPTQLDYKNCTRTDNRIDNLRQATYRQNAANRMKTARELPKGVRRRTANLAKPFEANIRVEDRLIYLGLYRTADEASKAYHLAAKKYFGSYARSV